MTNGMMYQQAFGFYMEFSKKLMKDNLLIKQRVTDMEKTCFCISAKAYLIGY
jgi:hypothetical protein